MSAIYFHPRSASQHCPADHQQRQHRLSIPLRWNGWLFLLFSLPNEVPPYLIMISAIKEAIYRSNNSVLFSLAKIDFAFSITTEETRLLSIIIRSASCSCPASNICLSLTFYNFRTATTSSSSISPFSMKPYFAYNFLAISFSGSYDK